MKSIVRAIATAVIASAPALCLAQIVRVEMHPIQSVTMTDQDFLNGRKDAKPVTLAGQLKIPRAGSERLPAVVLLHGRQPFSYADPCVELGLLAPRTRGTRHMPSRPATCRC